LQTEYLPYGQSTGQFYLSCKAFFELKNLNAPPKGNGPAGSAKYLEWLQFSFMQTCSKTSSGEYPVEPKDRQMYNP